MARTPRLDYPGARHHVMNRGARREPVFLDDRICALFVDTLGELPQRFGLRVHGYALMPNHFHLMLKTPEGNLSRAMRHLGAVFTQRLNAHERWDGPVFRGRFHNKVIESDAYWQHLLAYLHLNPVKAHLAKKPSDSIWSSHAAYIDAMQRPDWLTTEELLDAFGGSAAFAEYVQNVQIGRQEAPEGFDHEHFFSTSKTEIVPERQDPEPRSLEQALADAAEVAGVTRRSLARTIRTPKGNPATWLAAWWATRTTDATQDAIGKALGVSRARVSQYQKQLYARAKSDPLVAAWMHKLEAGAHA